MNTIELIAAIERRPGMYVDPTSIQSLVFFVHGYLFARSQGGLLAESDRRFSDGFYPWLKVNHSLQDAATWGELIQQLADREGVAAVPIFFREFKGFLAVSTTDSPTPKTFGQS